MTTTPKIFLIISIAGFLIGFSEFGDSILFQLGRPVGAIFFGLFLIFHMLAKESARFDDEHGEVIREQQSSTSAPRRHHQTPRQPGRARAA